MQETSSPSWQELFWNDLERDAALSPAEQAGFLAILDGFTVAGGNLEANADHVLQLIQMGTFKIWGHSVSIDMPTFLAISFKDEKWEPLAGKAMQTLHLQGSDKPVHPRSLIFLKDDEKSKIARGFLQSIQQKVGKRYSNQHAQS